jgi:hypothetical protein
MPRLTFPRTALLLTALLLVFAVGFAVEALALFPSIGCEADGFCNSQCLSDPDCGEPSCEQGKPCTTDADCEPLGECATWRQCVCFG